jgi:hypothetical protein
MTLPKNVEYLGDYAFFNCYNLSKAVIFSPNIEFAWDVFSSIPTETFTLYGKAGSTTEGYAEELGITFVLTNELSTVLLGDITGDVRLNIHDVILLFQHSRLPNVYHINYNGNTDFNKDGTLNIADSILLFRHILLPNLYPLEN